MSLKKKQNKWLLVLLTSFVFYKLCVFFGLPGEMQYVLPQHDGVGLPTKTPN